MSDDKATRKREALASLPRALGYVHGEAPAHASGCRCLQCRWAAALDATRGEPSSPPPAPPPPQESAEAKRIRLRALQDERDELRSRELSREIERIQAEIEAAK